MKSNETSFFILGFAGATSRERCDSMPSRARTSSEGTHSIQSWNPSKYHGKTHRPSPCLVKDIMQSPPIQPPMSPPSASTDSAGSSLSIDEPWPDDASVIRFGHSITPEETIAEEDYTIHRPLGNATSPLLSYLPMGPIKTDESYVDMSPGGGKHINTSPTASSSSITSGTPSTDLRFSEYPLERGYSFFPPSEEDLNNERPARANSIGARPDPSKNNAPKMDLHNKFTDNSRVRAFSVGSNKNRKVHTRILPPHTHAVPGVKSSSAPILLSSKNYNSLDPMEDLMEIDFTRSSNLNTSGYVEMKPGRANSGYVEMKLGSRQDSLSKTPDNCPYMDMRPGSSPTRHPLNLISPQTENAPTVTSQPDYMDMDPRRNKHIAKPSTSPSLSTLSPSNDAKQGYMDMSFNKNRPDCITFANEPFYSSCKNTLPPYQPHESPSSIEYMDMSFRPRTSSITKNKPQNDGYVEMSLGSQKSGHQRQSSWDSAKITSDYTNMSIGSSKKERKPSKKDKTKSQPIQIQNNTNQVPKLSSPSSPMYASLFGGRKHSTGTPPKMYLPLSTSPWSSLPRQHSRKNSTSRRDSKDSSSSSINTPSSSSTIFPISLNSPSSPVKQLTTNTHDPVVLKVPASVLNIKYTVDDYTMMDFDKRSSTNSDNDYVNYNPVKNKVIQQKIESGDYAIMKPGIPVNQTKLLNKPLTTSQNSFRPITDNQDYAMLEPSQSSSSPCCDAKENHLENKCKRPSSVSSDSNKSNLSRPSSTSSDIGSTTSTIVGINSRPASSNSDRIKHNIEGQLHYASLDLTSTKNDDDESLKSPKLKLQDESNVRPSTPSQVQTPFVCTYADIDFVKSEGLNHSLSNNNNTKLK